MFRLQVTQSLVPQSIKRTIFAAHNKRAFLVPNLQPTVHSLIPSLIIYSYLRELYSEHLHLQSDCSRAFPIHYDGMKIATTHNLYTGHHLAKSFLIPHQNTVDWFDKQRQHLQNQAVCKRHERR